MAVAFDTSAAGLTFTHLVNLDSHVSITGNVPSAVVEGDAILALFIHRGSGNPDTVTPPVAFTEIQNGMGGNGGFKTHSWLGYKIAGASEPASYDWTFSADTRDKTIILLRVTGADAAFFEALAFDDDEYGTSVSAPSVTSLTDNAMLLTIIAGRQGSTFNGALPTGMTRISGGTSRINSNATNWEISSLQLGAAGATGVKTYTDYYSASSYVTAYSLVIKPAVASGPTITDITDPVSDSLSVTLSEATVNVDESVVDSNVMPITTSDDTTFDVTLNRSILPPHQAVMQVRLVYEEADVVSTNVELVPPTGYGSITVASPVFTEDSIFYEYTGDAPIDGDIIMWSDSPNTSVDATGVLTQTVASSVDLIVWQDSSYSYGATTVFDYTPSSGATGIVKSLIKNIVKSIVK